jgi:prophage regulatory protein
MDQMQTKIQAQAETKGFTCKERFLRLREVLVRTGLTRSMAYALLKDGHFPRSINLGPRAVGWLESEIDSWIAERVQASRSAKAKAV